MYLIIQQFNNEAAGLQGSVRLSTCLGPCCSLDLWLSCFPHHWRGITAFTSTETQSLFLWQPWTERLLVVVAGACWTNFFLNLDGEFKKKKELLVHFSCCAWTLKTSPPHRGGISLRDKDALLTAPFSSYGPLTHFLSQLHPLFQPEVLVTALAAERGGLLGLKMAVRVFLKKE